MKKNTQIARFVPVALIIVVATVFMFATTATAFAEGAPLGVVTEMTIIETAQGPLVIEEMLAVAEMLPLQPEQDGPFPDGGDWEMVPRDPEIIPDGGDDEMVPEPLDEGEENDGAPEDEQVEQDTPEASQEQTRTDVPEEPEDEPRLPFTGGNATPFAIGGLLVALAGVAVLVARRKVFAR